MELHRMRTADLSEVAVWDIWQLGRLNELRAFCRWQGPGTYQVIGDHGLVWEYEVVNPWEGVEKFGPAAEAG